MNGETLAGLVVERLRTSLPHVDELTIDSMTVHVDSDGDMNALADRIAEAIVREIQRMA